MARMPSFPDFAACDPWFNLARRGAGIEAFEVPPGAWTVERLSIWCGWLAGRRWPTLARFLDAGWQPPEEARVFADARAGDAAVRAAMNGPVAEARHVLTHAPHPAALLAVAEPSYVLTHPLRRAVHQKWADMVVALLDAGADPGLSCKGLPGNALNHAAAVGWTEGVRLLIEAGADPNARDDGGRTALQVAAELGLCASVRELVACGARLDADGAHGVSLLRTMTRQHRGVAVRGERLRETVGTLLELGAPLGLPEGKPGWRIQARWAKRAELAALARQGEQVLLERTLPLGEEGRRRGRL